jgi:hypothetical protein
MVLLLRMVPGAPARIISAEPSPAWARAHGYTEQEIRQLDAAQSSMQGPSP